MAYDNDAVGGKLFAARSPEGVSGSVEGRSKARREAAVLGAKIVATVGAEAANIRIAILQLQDNAGNSIAEIANFAAWLVEDADGIQAVVAAASITDGGVGTEVYGDGTPNYVGNTDATGKADLDITDEAGASGKTFWLHVRLLSAPGVETAVSIAFD